MDIYLMQHGESKSKEEDSARPLTDAGREATENVSMAAANLGVAVDRVYHSGKLRAKETAEILARHLNARVEARVGLDPLDKVSPTRDWLKRSADQGRKPIAIVGHLPFLERLASLLVTGDEGVGVVVFRYGTLVKLTPKPDGDLYAVDFILTPEFARSMLRFEKIHRQQER